MNGRNAIADQIQAVYGQIPLSFEANRGQTDAEVRFLSHGPGYALFLTATDAVLSLSKPVMTGDAPSASIPGMALGTAEAEVLRLRLVGSQAAPIVTGLEPQASRSNYLIGNDPAGLLR